MVDNIKTGFLGQKSVDAEVAKQTEEVRKAISEVSKRFEATTSALSAALKTTTNNKTKKQLQDLVNQADSIKAAEKKLKTKGQSITAKEAKGLLQTAKNVNNAVQSSDDIQHALKLRGSELEKLDINKPLESASKRIGRSASNFFVENAEKISQQGLAQDVATTGLRAISPEAAAITESLGINLGDTVKGLFKGDEDSGDEQVSSLNKLKDSVDNVVDAISSSSTEEVAINSTNREFESDKMEVEAKQHRELIDKVDDVVDALSGKKGILSGIIPSLPGKGRPVVIPPVPGGKPSGKSSKAKDFLGKTKGAAVGAAGKVKDFIKGGSLKGVLGKLGIAGALGTIAAIGLEDVDFGPLTESFKTLGSNISSKVKESFNNLSAMTSEAFEGAVELYNGVMPGVEERLKSGIKEGFVLARKFTSDAMEEGVNLYKLATGQKTNDAQMGVISSFYKDAITNTTDAIASGIGFFKNPGKTFKKIFSPLGDFFTDIGFVISDFFSNAIVKLETTVGDFLSESVFGGDILRKKVGFRTSTEVQAEQTKAKAQLVSQAKAMNVSPDDLDAFQKGRLTDEQFTERTKEFRAPKVKKNELAKMQQAALLVDSKDSKSQLEGEISQATAAQAIIQSNSEVTTQMQKQQKETVKVITKENTKNQKQATTNVGRMSLDNTPIHSTDIGMTYILGGG